MDDKQRSGDEAVVEEYGPAVYRLAFAQLRSKPDAEDVFQEVFLRYVDKAPVFQSQDHEKAWFLRVTLNCCKDLSTADIAQITGCKPAAVRQQLARGRAMLKELLSEEGIEHV